MRNLLSTGVDEVLAAVLDDARLYRCNVIANLTSTINRYMYIADILNSISQSFSDASVRITKDYFRALLPSIYK